MAVLGFRVRVLRSVTTGEYLGFRKGRGARRDAKGIEGERKGSRG